jgi:hypothetical protein
MAVPIPMPAAAPGEIPPALFVGVSCAVPFDAAVEEITVDGDWVKLVEVVAVVGVVVALVVVARVRWIPSNRKIPLVIHCSPALVARCNVAAHSDRSPEDVSVQIEVPFSFIQNLVKEPASVKAGGTLSEPQLYIHRVLVIVTVFKLGRS